jgi:hypothetical protein
MKKIVTVCIATLGTIGMYACGGGEHTENDLDDNKAVVERDTIVTEYEVEETIVEYDTTTRTKTVDRDIE